jgi:predicted P-loop ATPase
MIGFAKNMTKNLARFGCAPFTIGARECGWDETQWDIDTLEQESDDGADATTANKASPAGSKTRPRPITPATSIYAKVYNCLLRSEKAFIYDEFHDEGYCGNKRVDDDLIGQLRAYCTEHIVSKERIEGKDPHFNTAREAVIALCYANRVDPEKDWLLSLQSQWDGVERLDKLFVGYCGSPDTPLNRAIGRKIMIGKVTRGIYPGAPHDWAPVMEAPTGTGKTGFARALAGSQDRVLDAPIMHLNTQKQQEMLLGVTIHELSEMNDIKRADLNTIKSFVSRTHDRAHKAWGHFPVLQGRRSICIGTTEEGQYLVDEHNRRFNPIKTPKIDLKALEQDREQLHAEAVIAMLNGETSVLPNSLWADAANEQRKRREEDPWEDTLMTHIEAAIDKKPIAARGPGQLSKTPKVVEISYKGKNMWFASSHDVLSIWLEIMPDQQRGYIGKRANSVMKRLGWDNVRIDNTVLGGTKRGFMREIAAGRFDRDYLSMFEKDINATSTANAAPNTASV